MSRNLRMLGSVLLPCVAVLCHAQTNLLDAPPDFRVFQRNAQNWADVPIAGTAVTNTGLIEAQATLAEGLRGTAVGWQVIAQGGQIRNGRFSGSLRLAAGGWYALRVRCRKSADDPAILGEAAVEHVGVGDVFAVAGQSNSANHGEEKQRTRTGLVATFDGARWQPANDPQPGASGGGGSFLPPFGDALVERFHVPVGLISCGIGATSVREWLPRGVTFPNPPTIENRVTKLTDGGWACKGHAFDTLVGRMRQLGTNGFRAVLWHQGESDANQPDPSRSLSREQYRTYLEQIIRESRREIGWMAPWFVARVSYHTPAFTGSPEIGAAQQSLWEDGVALEGPDSDALQGDFREAGGKGVHFSGKGLREHGARWAEKVGAWLEKDSRANAEAFRQMRYGLFVHQVHGLTAWPDGRRNASLDEFAAAFDVQAFADQIESTGVEYVYLTAWHKAIYLLGPNRALERWLPGHTAGRDLVGEIADALESRKIRLVIYAHPNDGHDLTPEEQARVGFSTRGQDGNRKYNDFINEVYAELAARYSRKPAVLGFWWDSWWHNGRPLDMPRLRQTVLSQFPAAILLSNNYDPKYIDFNSMEGGRMGSLQGIAAQKDNQTWYLGADWWNNNPKATVGIQPDDLYRFLVLTVGAGAPGGMSWDLSPLADGKTWGADNQPLKVLQELNRRLAPVRATLCGTASSRNWPLPSGTDWAKAPAFVATRSLDGQREYVHVLKPPANRVVELPRPTESFASARLYLSQRPVAVALEGDRLLLTLPDGEPWSALDTIVEMSCSPK